MFRLSPAASSCASSFEQQLIPFSYLIGFCHWAIPCTSLILTFLWVSILPSRELGKIQDGPRHFDQRKSFFFLGVVRESRKLLWSEFCLCASPPSYNRRMWHKTARGPTDSSHPLPQSGTLIKCSYPQVRNQTHRLQSA